MFDWTWTVGLNTTGEEVEEPGPERDMMLELKLTRSLKWHGTCAETRKRSEICLGNGR